MEHQELAFPPASCYQFSYGHNPASFTAAASFGFYNFRGDRISARAPSGRAPGADRATMGQRSIHSGTVIPGAGTDVEQTPLRSVARLGAQEA